MRNVACVLSPDFLCHCDVIRTPRSKTSPPLNLSWRTCPRNFTSCGEAELDVTSSFHKLLLLLPPKKWITGEAARASPTTFLVTFTLLTCFGNSLLLCFIVFIIHLLFHLSYFVDDLNTKAKSGHFRPILKALNCKTKLFFFFLIQLSQWLCNHICIAGTTAIKATCQHCRADCYIFKLNIFTRKI